MKNGFPVYNISSLSDVREDDIMVSRFNPYLKIHKNLSSAHRHSFYHIVMFTEGQGTHQIDFTRFAVKPFQIYFMIPGQVHSWDFVEPVDGYIVNFSASFFQSFLLDANVLERFSFFSGFAEEQVIQIPSEQHAEMTGLFESMIEERKDNRTMGADMVRVLLLNLFIRVSRLKATDAPGPRVSFNDTLLRNFRMLIEQNYRVSRLPKDYASMLYITPNHLNSLCNDLLGVPAGELIRSRVLLEAKRLLVNLDMTVSQIADDLNFADNSYFSRFFKKQVGMTPEMFRKSALLNDENNGIETTTERAIGA
ncbi:helix-turn-helix domain-containing protein [Flavihumibacter sp. R14]|nr:helix-turn-helix domain-containing protein [Flavihumibacter soli]